MVLRRFVNRINGIGYKTYMYMYFDATLRIHFAVASESQLRMILQFVCELREEARKWWTGSVWNRSGDFLEMKVKSIARAAFGGSQPPAPVLFLRHNVGGRGKKRASLCLRSKT